MKLKPMPGFAQGAPADDKPKLAVFGRDGSGKTRLATTMPQPIGVIAIDLKCKRIFEDAMNQRGVVYIANDKPIISDAEAAKMAMSRRGALDAQKDLEKDEAYLTKSMEFYGAAVKKVFDMAIQLANNPEIPSVVVDTSTTFFEWCLWKHFGRTQHIPPMSRNVVNQDMIDLITLLRGKNTLYVHWANEVWKPTGRFQKNGDPIKEPSGKYELQGFKDIGRHVNAVLELFNKPRKEVDDKFRVVVQKCQTNALLEGVDLHEGYGVSGEDISWDNLMVTLGIEV